MKKQELVVKSNRLVEASYRLTLNEQRIPATEPDDSEEF